MQLERLKCRASCLTTNNLPLFSSIGPFGFLKIQIQNPSYSRVSEWNHLWFWRVASALLIADMQLALNDWSRHAKWRKYSPNSTWCLRQFVVRLCSRPANAALPTRLSHPWQWAFTARHRPPSATICWGLGQTRKINDALPQGRRTLLKYWLRVAATDNESGQISHTFTRLHQEF